MIQYIAACEATVGKAAEVPSIKRYQQKASKTQTMKIYCAVTPLFLGGWSLGPESGAQRDTVPVTAVRNTRTHKHTHTLKI